MTFGHYGVYVEGPRDSRRPAGFYPRMTFETATILRRTKMLIKRVPLLGLTITAAYQTLRRIRGERTGFENSNRYWENRYQHGGDSGAGSYGRLAAFKAQVLNEFVELNGISRVIEFGCGDGNQLSLARYPTYLGFDTSETAVRACRRRFLRDGSKTFELVSAYAGQTGELSVSLDVIYHLVEDTVYESYMELLFSSSSAFVIIYSSNSTARESQAAHVRHRKFTDWIGANKSDWVLLDFIPNAHPARDDATGSFADFFILGKRDADRRSSDTR